MKKLIAMLTLGALAALLLTACGSSSNVRGVTTTPTEAPAATAQPTEAPTAEPTEAPAEVEPTEAAN